MMIAIVGKKRKGKTVLAKNLILDEKYNQIFILDFLREYQYLKTWEKFFVYENIYDLYSFVEAVWDSELTTKKTNTLVVFDEIHMYGKNSRPIETLFRFGAHWNIDIIAISHRFVDLHPNWREQVDEYRVFKLTDRADKNFLKDYISDEEIEKISNLDTLEYITLEL
ncbi:hypothetical protein ES702_07702 [subsurface metagenome]